MGQAEVDLGQGQGDPRERLLDVAQLGLGRTERLAPDRHVEEQVADLDRRADRSAARADLGKPTAGTFDLCAVGLVGRATANRRLAHFRDRRQRLAAEAERAHPKQIVGILNLARGVAGQGQLQLPGGNAASVVHDADHFRSAALGGHVDSRGTGVDGVLHQLLDDARGALDHLAGGDLVDQAL